LRSGLFRVGFGEDAHRLADGRPLIIGGVSIASERGSDAHSDGDVLLHALSDALLSVFALGDIGQLYPPGRPETAGLDSAVILEAVRRLVLRPEPSGPEGHEGGWRLVNVAAVVTLDAPKLGPYRTEVQGNVEDLLQLSAGSVGVTFKTSEGLAPDHVQARVTVLLGK
jgi:2-C-methyl-D-erythritol 2,4-cyclodiphosphate synthase